MDSQKTFFIFLKGFVISCAVFFSLNVLQSQLSNFIYSKEIAKNPPMFLLAGIADKYQIPVKQPKIQVQGGDIIASSTGQAVLAVDYKNQMDCQILAKSAISVLIQQDGTEVLIFEKSAKEKMPIASLAKLMSAVVANEFYDPDYKITVSKKATDQEETAGYLKIGEALRVIDLIYIMLIESSNDAAFALAEPSGVSGFVDLMNLKAKDLGLADTYFVNPTGLDEISGQDSYSTAWDLGKIGKYVMDKPGLMEIISKKEFSLYLEDGSLHHILKNTNELLGESGVVAGKTGNTGRAGGCLLVISKGENASSTKISVVLNSSDRFNDMRKLLYCASFK